MVLGILKVLCWHLQPLLTAGNKLEGDIVLLQAQTSPYFQLREKFNCIVHIAKSETQLKTS